MEAGPAPEPAARAKTALRARVLGGERVGGHVEYCVELGDAEGYSWQVRRRFRDLVELHGLLRLQHGGALPPLPARRAFGLGKLLVGPQDWAFVLERQEEVQRYLSALIEMDPSVSALVLRKFLGCPALDKHLRLEPPLLDLPLPGAGQWQAGAELLRRPRRGRPLASLADVPLSVLEARAVAVEAAAGAGATAACKYRAASRTAAEHLRKVVPSLFLETSCVYVCSSWAGRGPKLACFSPRSGLWEERSDGPLEGDVATCSAGGELYVFSLADSAGSFRRWDRCSGRWHALPTLPEPRRARFSVGAAGGSLYAFGGISQDRPLDMAHRFDSSRQVWEPLPRMPAARADCAVASLLGGLYVLGGTGGGGQPCDRADSFLPRSGRWATLPPLPQPRHGCAAVGANGSVFLFGGSLVARSHEFADACVPPKPLRLDLQAGAWEVLSAPESVQRLGLCAVALAGSVYVLGGYAQDFADVDRLQLGSSCWDVLPMPAALRGRCSAAVVAS